MSREPKANQVACCAIFDAILSAERPAALAAPPSPLPVERLQLLLPRCGLFDEVDRIANPNLNPSPSPSPNPNPNPDPR